MEIIDDISRETLFYYIAIFVFILFLFSMIEIKLNIIFGTLLGAVLMIYLYSNEKSNTDKTNEINKDKLNSIVPPTQTKYHPDITNFLFSIQDLYIYNQRSYEGMVENIDRFFSLYSEVKINNSLAGRNYDLMKTQKRISVNYLMEINFGMKPNLKYDNKLKVAVETLDELLNKHMVEIYRIYQNEIYLNGYNSRTILVDKHNVIPYNTYDEVMSNSIF